MMYAIWEHIHGKYPPHAFTACCMSAFLPVGRSLFEKQISGLFLGELARRILLRCMAGAAAAGTARMLTGPAHMRRKAAVAASLACSTLPSYACLHANPATRCAAQAS